MSDGGSGSATIDRWRAHLAELPGAVGCRHLARERDGVDASLLVTLGLVKPIVSRVPRCADHDCPWLPQCAHWSDFEPEASGNKAGVKYRPTPTGVVASLDASVALAAVTELPAVADVLASLAEGPATVFALHARFLKRMRDAARHGADPSGVGVSRSMLGSVLDVLVGAGLVVRTGDEVTYVRGDYDP